jgi:hypothetical protein
MLNAKQSLCRPGQENEAPEIPRQSAHEGGKVFSPIHRPPLLPQEISLVLIFVRWIMSMKNEKSNQRPSGL